MSACMINGLYQPLRANLFGRMKSTSCLRLASVSTPPVATLAAPVRNDVIAGCVRLSPSIDLDSCVSASAGIGDRTVTSPPPAPGPRSTTNSDRNRRLCGGRSKLRKSLSDVRVTSAGYVPPGNSAGSRALRKNCIMRSAASLGMASTGTSLKASWNKRRGLGSCLSSLANHARCPS